MGWNGVETTGEHVRTSPPTKSEATVQNSRNIQYKFHRLRHAYPRNDRSPPQEVPRGGDELLKKKAQHQKQPTQGETAVQPRRASIIQEWSGVALCSFAACLRTTGQPLHRSPTARQGIKRKNFRHPRVFQRVNYAQYREGGKQPARTSNTNERSRRRLNWLAWPTEPHSTEMGEKLEKKSRREVKGPPAVPARQHPQSANAPHEKHGRGKKRDDSRKAPRNKNTCTCMRACSTWQQSRASAGRMTGGSRPVLTKRSFVPMPTRPSPPRRLFILAVSAHPSGALRDETVVVLPQCLAEAVNVRL